jgi:hypothetical protein
MSKDDLMLMSMDQLIGLMDVLNAPQLDLGRVAECCEEVANRLLDVADDIAADRASFGKSV